VHIVPTTPHDKFILFPAQGVEPEIRASIETKLLDHSMCYKHYCPVEIFGIKIAEYTQIAAKKRQIKTFYEMDNGKSEFI
jgi:hypothetical protein